MRAAGRRTLEEMRQAGADRRALEAAVATHDAAIAAAAERHGGSAIREAPPQIGDAVEVTGQGIRGELVDIAGERAHIRRGALRFEVPTRSLKRIPGGASRGRGRDERAPGYREVRDADMPAVGNEITLLGLGARDAVTRLDEYLDRAVRVGHASVRVIHGIGGGVLRRAVLDYLNGSPYCTRFREGSPAEGGVGVTLVELTDHAA
jgi:DNA mismatch repair protein MutS2